MNIHALKKGNYVLAQVQGILQAVKVVSLDGVIGVFGVEKYVCVEPKSANGAMPVRKMAKINELAPIPITVGTLLSIIGGEEVMPNVVQFTNKAVIMPANNKFMPNAWLYNDSNLVEYIHELQNKMKP